MNRRGFLGRMIGAAAATVTPASVAAAVGDAFTVDLPMTEELDLRKEALNDLSKWWMDRQDEWFCKQLTSEMDDHV